MTEVVEGLLRELDARANEVEGSFDTLYVGGGTPSILPDQLIAKLLGSVIKYCRSTETTLEVNPEDVSAEKAALWHSLGVNRISIGIQTIDDKRLRSLGRRHTGAQALKAIEILHEAGITNVSADLIYGLPGLSDCEWQHTLEVVLATGIKHLSAYCLTYHEGTALQRMYERGIVVPATDEEVERQFKILRQVSESFGFEHYEISNLALPGYRSRHNSSYWNPSSQWLGIGPSAHSFDGKARRIDFADTTQWLKNLPTPYEIERETETEIVNDNIVTSLRTLDGLDLQTVPEEYRQTILHDAQRFIETGDMTLSDGQNLTITPSQWLISDYFIRALMR